jgi:hypothetical protein
MSVRDAKDANDSVWVVGFMSEPFEAQDELKLRPPKDKTKAEAPI